jgi:hypothetical protein
MVGEWGPNKFPVCKQQERILEGDIPELLKNTSVILDTTDQDDTQHNPPVISIARNGEVLETYALSDTV